MMKSRSLSNGVRISAGIAKNPPNVGKKDYLRKEKSTPSFINRVFATKNTKLTIEKRVYDLNNQKLIEEDSIQIDYVSGCLFDKVRTTPQPEFTNPRSGYFIRCARDADSIVLKDILNSLDPQTQKGVIKTYFF
jgi:hypothetical protein